MIVPQGYAQSDSIDTKRFCSSFDRCVTYDCLRKPSQYELSRATCKNYKIVWVDYLDTNSAIRCREYRPYASD